MNSAQLVSQIKKLKSFLCVGLDPDLNKMPIYIQEKKEPIFEFNKAIIDATSPYCVAYKLNIAFFERYGIEGYIALEKTIKYIPKNKFIILDAKRGDIGNTATMYSNAYFNNLGVDAVTLSPYMGKDSITPFLEKPDKWAILLGLTSNTGAEDFQLQKMESGEQLYEKIIKVSKTWGTDKNIMYVVGATKTKFLKKVRELVPNHFLLVPGVGTQGGSLEEVVRYGINKNVGLLVNCSRAIIYASKEEDFSKVAGKVASEIKEKMGVLLTEYEI